MMPPLHSPIACSSGPASRASTMRIEPAVRAEHEPAIGAGVGGPHARPRRSPPRASPPRRRAAARSSRCAEAAYRRTAPAHRRSPPCGAGIPSAPAGRRAPHRRCRAADPGSTLCAGATARATASIRGPITTTVAAGVERPQRLEGHGESSAVRRSCRTFGSGRFHARALAGGEDDGGETGSAHRRARRKIMRNETRSSGSRVACPIASANTQIVAEYERRQRRVAEHVGYSAGLRPRRHAGRQRAGSANALNQVLRERGFAPLSPAEVAPMVGDGVPALVARGFRRARRQRRRGGRGAAALYRDLRGECDGPDPALSRRAGNLAALRRRGYRTAVCTNKLQQATEAVLTGSIWPALFDGVAGGDRYPVRKPDTGHLLGLIAELGGTAGARRDDRRQRERRRSGACRRRAARA